jgi:hypothetical protein
MVREFKNAANKLLDCMSTFQSPEIISFQKLIWYAVVTSMMTLERKDIKENVRTPLFAQANQISLFLNLKFEIFRQCFT